MLASILGKSGEVFFPKLGAEQMLTFSAICDDFIREQGLNKYVCSSDAEAKNFAQSQITNPQSPTSYPIVYSKSNTTGEKAYEEFYTQGETLDMQRFDSLGVVEKTIRQSLNKVNEFFDELEHIVANPDFSKAEVVDAIKRFIPNFEHEEKGRNLDQKM